ncbi:MAG: hypothetical protein K9M98_09620 [Cephaloticoccus sp.]|nr:hypothetical protein [Cephaloticoccus sp.]MCF7760751.1 hypothetical protein [Cephaloticoccus sp.]
MAKLSPHDVRRRVLRISKMNGWSVAIIAGLGALISLLFGDPIGLGVGLLVMLGGITELRGHQRLLRHDINGIRLLVRAQLIVLGVVWVYAISRLGSFDADFALSNQTPEMRQILTEAGVDTAELITLIRLVFYVLYSSVMAVTLIYQGGLALYYHRRTAAVQEAITNPIVPPVVS